MARSTSRVSRVLMTGPLARFAEVYRLELKERGCTPLTMVNQLRQVARLSRWLEANGLGAAELNGRRVDEFLAFQRGLRTRLPTVETKKLSLRGCGKHRSRTTV